MTMRNILAYYCFIQLVWLCGAQEDIADYQKFQQRWKQLKNISEHVGLSSLNNLEREFGQILDLETILKSITKSNDDLKTVFEDSNSIFIQSTAVPPLPEVSGQCLNDSLSMVEGLAGRKSWAIAMIDAVGKPPSGILTGKITWLGNYEQCLAADAGIFQGQYCLQPLYLSTLANPVYQTPGTELKVGICMPNSCTSGDIKNLLNSVIGTLSNNTVVALDGVCQEPNQPYDLRAKIVLVVIAVFVTVMTIATVYDIILRHYLTPVKDGSKKESGEGNAENGKVNIAYIPNEKSSAENGEIGIGYNSKENNTDANGDLGYKFKEDVNSDNNGSKSNPGHKPGLFGKLLLCFSVYTNGEKILNPSQGAGSLTAVNGIRFISMTWVILGHTLGFGVQQVGNIASYYKELLSRYSFMAIMNAEVSVDTFFALSGCLLTYLVLKQLKKQEGKLDWFMFYFHRFWRLTPPYMLVMMVYVSLFQYLGGGPFWIKDFAKSTNCEDNWWYNLLYINNFKSGAEECFGHAWYLANDMQFFVVSPLLIIPMYRSKVAGNIVTGVFLLLTTVAGGVVSKHYSLSAKIEGDYFDQYYQRPYCRMGPYIVGMYTGFLLYNMNCKCKINKYLNIVLWLVFATLACAVLYGVYGEYNNNEMSTDVAALYNAVHKSVWGAAVCWVIFACATGNGGFINTILSWKPFVPLGRLTYCAYLIHPAVLYYYFISRKELMYWDDYEIIILYLGLLALSYASAFLASLAFEAPMMALEKVIFKRGK